MLRPYVGPGLFITGTGTDVGKTTVTAALAAAFHRMHLRVGICKPLASGCAKRAERGNELGRPLGDDDYVSADAALAASVFHYGTIPIPEVKRFLKEKKVSVR